MLWVLVHNDISVYSYKKDYFSCFCAVFMLGIWWAQWMHLHTFIVAGWLCDSLLHTPLCICTDCSEPMYSCSYIMLYSVKTLGGPIPCTVFVRKGFMGSIWFSLPVYFSGSSWVLWFRFAPGVGVTYSSLVAASCNILNVCSNAEAIHSLKSAVSGKLGPWPPLG